ncbi:unnamed protein product [Closterium sp. Naga37s-1]|nr:unnamed protein product [Closterium sp. Naga37s-1]
MPFHSRRSASSCHDLLPLLLLVLPFISHVSAQASAKTYPLCPFTQKPPAKPNVTMSRCVDASEHACCADCSDASNALHGLTANQTVVLEMLKPEIVAIIGNKDVQVTITRTCSYDLEQLYCAITCNPDGGTYVKASTATTGVLTVCDAYATQVYGDCKDVPMMGQATLGSLLSNKEIFIKLVFGLLFARFSGINVTVNVAQGQSACYNGPSKPLPPKPVCCETFTNTPGCSFKNDSLLAPYVGRPINPNACSAYINGTSASDPTSTGTSNSGSSSSQGSSASSGSPPKDAPKTAMSSVFMLTQALLLVVFSMLFCSRRIAMAEKKGIPAAQGARGENSPRIETSARGDRRPDGDDGAEPRGAERHEALKASSKENVEKLAEEEKRGEERVEEEKRGEERVEEEKRGEERVEEGKEGDEADEDYLVLSEVHVACPSHHVSTVSTFAFRLPPAVVTAEWALRGEAGNAEGWEGSEDAGRSGAAESSEGIAGEREARSGAEGVRVAEDADGDLLVARRKRRKAGSGGGGTGGGGGQRGNDVQLPAAAVPRGKAMQGAAGEEEDEGGEGEGGVEAGEGGGVEGGGEEGEGEKGEDEGVGAGGWMRVVIRHSMKTTIAHVGMQVRRAGEVWRAALLLADVMVANHRLLGGATVLELGAGAGTPGGACGALGTGHGVLPNCAANAADAAMAHSAASALTGTSWRPPSPVAAALVRRLDWRHGWPPPVVTRQSGLHQSVTRSGSSSAPGRAAGAQAEMGGAVDPFNGIDPFGWTEEEVSDASNATVLLAADVIYSDDITCAFFTTLCSVLRCGPPKLLLLALEKRFNFSLSHLAPVANGYAVFRSHFAAQNGAPSWYSGGHCSSTQRAEKPGEASCRLDEHTCGGRGRGVDGRQREGRGDGDGDDGNREGEEGEELLGWRMDVGQVPQHVVGWERGSDMELWIIGNQRSLPLVCAWIERGVGLSPCEGGEEDQCSPPEALLANP